MNKSELKALRAALVKFTAYVGSDYPQLAIQTGVRAEKLLDVISTVESTPPIEKPKSKQKPNSGTETDTIQA